MGKFGRIAQLIAEVPPTKWKMVIVAFIGAYCISSAALYVPFIKTTAIAR